MTTRTKIFLQGAGLVAVVTGAFSLARVASDNEVIRDAVSNYGYLGAFLISILSGFNLLVPIPVVSFMPLFIESGLSFWPVILVITFGITLADTLACFITLLSKHIATRASFGTEIFNKFHQFGIDYPRAPLVILFLYASFLPLPNELLLVPLTLARHPLKSMIPVVLVGNFVHQFIFSKGVLEIFNFF